MMRYLPIALLVLVAGQAQAKDAATADATETAREHFKQGVVYFKLGHYDEAISEFELGYASKPSPLFLFNIAQAARLAGKLEMAVDYYQRYVDTETISTPQLDEARGRLAALRSVLANQSHSAPPSEATPPSLVPSAAVSAAPAPLLQAAHGPLPRDASKPVWKRGWFWGTVVGIAGAAALAVGLGVGLGLQARGPTPTLPSPAPFDGTR